MRPFRIALCQIDVAVGDLDRNLARIRTALSDAERYEPDLIAFPELAISGYPPEDLILRPAFLDDARRVVNALAAEVGEAVVVVGFPGRGEIGRRAANAAAVLRDGRIVDVYRKRRLPNYGVFDEARYFRRGDRIPVYDLGGFLLGVNICEDIWTRGEPLSTQAEAGAVLAINLSASPFHVGKGGEREGMIRARAEDHGIAVAYCNLVGGQDELVFDGQSLIVDAEGSIVARGAAFAEDLLVADLDLNLDPDGGRTAGAVPPRARLERMELGPRRRAGESPSPGAGTPIEPRIADPPDSRAAQILDALALGLGDYFRKNGFAEACVGVSGGIDSAVTAAIAVRALGADRVHGLYLPSRHSSATSRSGARALCENLGIEFREIPIEPLFEAALKALGPVFGDLPHDRTEENLQARIRGTVLMALSNKFGWLVLAPGNKSELSVGYATLYGDMVGGFAVLKDLLKSDVYGVAEEINGEAGRAVIPAETIEREPTAELRPGQRDADTLPPYPVLDAILEAYVERDLGRREIVALGHPEETVRWVCEAVDRSEYKRRQAPPGIKITTRAFGKDRRMPITNRYRG